MAIEIRVNMGAKPNYAKKEITPSLRAQVQEALRLVKTRARRQTSLLDRGASRASLNCRVWRWPKYLPDRKAPSAASGR